ncbi:penicillin-binding protein 2 [Paenibacillus sp. GP183]|jgi:cell division protein FtsI/penicillin-binding protein 2|uniref:peptidoglycan D,D-transpeptidase FtsI family protein n=1 Tax=Paenibacillus sp. GP183 TaxID=1882751 RepID=UPI00089AE011|nr:penicillin-binding protein 2 [Paenibacillus sp. GP183]SEC74042.1 Cell division protein FtsI/penicillin-binding protein 2 [Paenibacillus sp. GP183]
MDKYNRTSATVKRRMFMILLVFMALLASIAGRLLWIQLVRTGGSSIHTVDLVKNSVSQRQSSLVLHTGRGDFYDWKLRPMTGETSKALVIFPVQKKIHSEDQQNENIARILGVSTAEWKTFSDHVKEPRLWSTKPDGQPNHLNAKQEELIDLLQLPNVRVVAYEKRYPQSMAAKQLIGFIGENPERIKTVFGKQLAHGDVSLTSKIGGSGLEKSFEPLIEGIGQTSISYFTDNEKRPLTGLGTRLIEPTNPYYPLKVITTIDLDLQKKVEALMDSMNIREGAAVVLNAADADIRVMASKPDYNPEDVDPSQSNWSNHALKAIAPGSIFKTAVAVAALEEGVVKPGETFDCQGALGKYGFTCWKKEGHGRLTLQEGFAESCNIVFAKVMQRLSSVQLEKYAGALGLTHKAGWQGTAGQQNVQQLDSEDEGQLFAAGTPREDEGVRMQTAIGQRDVLLSPLQSANMIVTLLHGGERFSPRAASEIRYQTDRIMSSFTVQKSHTAISRATSRELLKWMETVVTEGTGKALQGTKWQLAGKSGTAQVLTGKQEKVNQWFIGYGPVHAPKYAVSVSVANVGPMEPNKAIPLFKGIMQILAESEQ